MCKLVASKTYMEMYDTLLLNTTWGIKEVIGIDGKSFLMPHKALSKEILRVNTNIKVKMWIDFISHVFWEFTNTTLGNCINMGSSQVCQVVDRC